MQLLQTIGARIRIRRKARGLSQEDVARIAGVSPGYIGQVERGEQNLTVESLDKVLRAIDVSFEELFLQADLIRRENAPITNIVTMLQSRSHEDQPFAEQLLRQMIEWNDATK